MATSYCRSYSQGDAEHRAPAVRAPEQELEKHLLIWPRAAAEMHLGNTWTKLGWMPGVVVSAPETAGSVLHSLCNVTQTRWEVSKAVFSLRPKAAAFSPAEGGICFSRALFNSFLHGD